MHNNTNNSLLPPPPESAEEEDDAGTLLAPGFRFHPTDDELVTYYLKRKIQHKPLIIDAISEVDLYKTEPWDLPSKSRIKSRDLEWYFFTPLDRKQSNNRLRTNRGTERGYWKTTGKDREVRHGGRVAGMKKTLVYHEGRAPKGKRSNWVMHEYRLGAADDGVEESYVVCRIFQKTGPGPQNGAQYGAPFVEEEWDKLTPGSHNNTNNTTNNIFLIGNSTDDSVEEECTNNGGVPFFQNQEPIPISIQENQENQENQSSTVLDGSSPSKTPDEYLELNDLASDLLLLENNRDGTLLNETLNFDDFFEPNDSSFMQMSSEVIYSPPPPQNNNSEGDFVDEFLTYYDAPLADDTLFYDDFEYSDKVINENSFVDSNGIQADASSSDKKPLSKFASFLDSFSAPPAFAEEFPATSSSKSVMDQVHVDPVHLTSNLIQIGNKADVELLLSYKFEENFPKYQCGVSSVLRGGFCMFMISAFMLLLSYKIGLCVCEH